LRFIAVDWSGARYHEQRHLWLAESRGAESSSDGLARLAPMTRAAAVDTVIAAAERDSHLVVGLDFAFSMPAWWLARLGIGDVGELWADAERLEAWLSSCPAPFWGRTGRRRPSTLAPEQHWRRTELALTPRPKSVFQLGGAGSVGTGSLRGMPALRRLRDAGFAVWPFDRAGLPLVLELWPRLFTGPVVKSHREARRQWLNAHRLPIAPFRRAQAEASEDAFDATAALFGLQAAWPTASGPGTRPRDEDGVIALEGWIWGSPDPRRLRL
jgi:hypothetical protein